MEEFPPNLFLSSYSHEAGGIVLAYSGMKMKERIGQIFSDHAFVRCSVQVRVLVMKLAVDEIHGELNGKEATSILV